MSGTHHHVEVMIPCSIGNLEGRFYYQENHNRKQGVVICPPHPLLAGNMDNNVVQAITLRVCAHIPVLLFNYRAVGKSTHPQPDLPLFEYWNRLDGTGDFQQIIEDTAAVLAWSRKFFQSVNLIGYSFGAYIALEAATDNVCSLTAITPPLTEHDFSHLNSFSKPIFSILAENDTLLEKQGGGHDLTINHITVQGTDHFFLGKENEIADIVLQNIMNFLQIAT